MKAFMQRVLFGVNFSRIIQVGTAGSALIFMIGITSCASQQPSASHVQEQTTISGKKWDLTTYKNPGPQYVTQEEGEAALWYTDEGSDVINPALRKGKASIIKRHDYIILNLASLVNKERSGRGKKCTFYRFIDGDPVLLDQMKTRGQVYVERGFFSATLDRHPDDEGVFSNKEYVITGTSSRCADISGYSSHQGENEVLFPPGTEFVVTKDMSGTDIYLREK
jgi:hypothetical protein